jgi:S-adenosylmethionine:tRNA ribosyltransferase-isomerase
VGERLLFSRTNSDRVELEAEVLSRGAFGQREIRFAPVADFFATLDRVGHIPLPPYIARPGSAADPEINDQERTDRERYQTIYANPRGSVAAPTAGLHFTSEILQRIRERGIETAEITLHVGLGTFQPIRVERVEAHRIHVEPYSISISAASALNQALKDSGRIVAIGTTTVRTLEHAIRAGGGQILEGAASADIFIYPGFEFRAVQAMLTNFHLPQSSLLMLVSAFAGRENVLRAYQHAVAERYRFYSYGDCMFIE